MASGGCQAPPCFLAWVGLHGPAPRAMRHPRAFFLFGFFFNFSSSQRAPPLVQGPRSRPCPLMISSVLFFFLFAAATIDGKAFFYRSSSLSALLFCSVSFLFPSRRLRLDSPSFPLHLAIRSAAVLPHILTSTLSHLHALHVNATLHSTSQSTFTHSPTPCTLHPSPPPLPHLRLLPRRCTTDATRRRTTQYPDRHRAIASDLRVFALAAPAERLERKKRRYEKEEDNR